MFDFLIIGAGAAGSITALKLAERGQNVLLVDKEGLFAGASGAAGAFFSPKLGKAYRLDAFINASLLHSLHYFKTSFPDCIDTKGVLMLPKNAKGGKEKFTEYENYIRLPFEKRDSGVLLRDAKEGFWFRDGAILDVDRLRIEVQKRVTFSKSEIKKVEKQDNIFLCDAFFAKNVIIATGASNTLHPEYIDITPVYGHRFECSSAQRIPFNLNGEFSVSATRRNGRFALGATHHRSQSAYEKSDGNELVKKAQEALGFSFEVMARYGGARATSVDHFPIIGKIVDVEHAKTLGERYLQAKKWKSDKLSFLEGMYVLNGLGARGFVYAPMCADLLINHIFEKAALPREVDGTRLLFRWFRKGS